MMMVPKRYWFMDIHRPGELMVSIQGDPFTYRRNDAGVWSEGALPESLGEDRRWIAVPEGAVPEATNDALTTYIATMSAKASVTMIDDSGKVLYEYLSN